MRQKSGTGKAPAQQIIILDRGYGRPGQSVEMTTRPKSVRDFTTDELKAYLATCMDKDGFEWSDGTTDSDGSETEH